MNNVTWKLNEIRSRLDQSYHSHYSSARRQNQDEIILKVCSSSKQSDDFMYKSGNINIVKRETWCVFTAGPMGVGELTFSTDELY